LLTAELGAMAVQREWGAAVSVSAHFLRPTSMTTLRTAIASISESGRVSVVDNTLYPADGAEPCATARVTFVRERAVALPSLLRNAESSCDPMLLAPGAL
jgi:hypothetical protein